jgi:class 3 adenylate cyclase
MDLDARSLGNKVDALLEERFHEQSIDTVPEAGDRRLTHGGTGLAGEFTFLYVDMRSSSALPWAYRRQSVAKLYKAFHHCMVEAVKAGNGRVRSFDGDRVLGIFAGASRADQAVETAMRMVGCKNEILIPKIRAKYQNDSFDIGIGVATGPALAIKAGVGHDMNNRDLVWIGDPPNLGSKLSDVARQPDSIYICRTTFELLGASNRCTTKSGEKIDLWEKKTLSLNYGQVDCYSSIWYRGLVS